MLTHAAGEEVGTPIFGLAKTPRASFVAFVPKAAISQVASRLERYSAQQQFRFQSRETRPDGLHLVVQLDRTDAEIIMLNPFDQVDPAEFRVSLYDAAAGATLQDQQVAAIIEQVRDALCGMEGLKCSPTTMDDH